MKIVLIYIPYSRHSRDSNESHSYQTTLRYTERTLTWSTCYSQCQYASYSLLTDTQICSKRKTSAWDNDSQSTVPSVQTITCVGTPRIHVNSDTGSHICNPNTQKQDGIWRQGDPQMLVGHLFYTFGKGNFFLKQERQELAPESCQQLPHVHHRACAHTQIYQHTYMYTYTMNKTTDFHKYLDFM